jgi:hypothetical protein
MDIQWGTMIFQLVSIGVLVAFIWVIISLLKYLSR